MQIDTAIIGGGPVGIYTGFRLGLNGIENLVLEAIDTAGGQCSNLYKEKNIYDLPGIGAVTGGEITERLMCQFSSTGKSDIIYNTNVSDIRRGESGFEVVTSGGEIFAKRIVIAVGAGAFEPRRLPAGIVSNEALDKVFYLVRSKNDFSCKKVAILGGGDSALDWALELSYVAKSVTLIHRGPAFRASDALVARIQNTDGVRIILNAAVAGIVKEAGGANVRIKTPDGEDGITADAVLAFYGMVSAANSIGSWSVGLMLDGGRIPVDPVFSKTNVDGVFAAGDISIYPGKKNNLLSGFFQSLQIANYLKTL